MQLLSVAHYRHFPQVLLLAALGLAGGCTSLRDSDSDRPYVPLFGDAVQASRQHPHGTIAASFAHAGSAKTIEDARRRWEEFLRRHPATSDFEDSSHWRYVEAALYELARIDYLLGRTESGDALIRLADPLELDRKP